MKLLIVLASLMSLNAFSADFYECNGFSGVDEYRAGIDMKKNKAGFFDNDTTSIMKLKKTLVLESNPPQVQHTYEGKDLGSQNSTLKLVFNQTLQYAHLSTINNKTKKVTDLGEVDCEPAQPWDL